ncbi:MAG: DUF2073 domain-containing protein [Candidatus Aenigmarchaeota archaeon]|nr:DUF2073 domain-containing protein [Candidatus Aenigmarchaeota archaeon]
MQLKIKLLPHKKILELKRGHVDWKIIRDLKNENILIIDEEITPSEQSILINEIMTNISDDFSGIEIACLDINKDKTLLKKLQKLLVRIISGKRSGMTIIGPANIVKKIKKNPEYLVVYVE